MDLTRGSWSEIIVPDRFRIWEYAFNLVWKEEKKNRKESKKSAIWKNLRKNKKGRVGKEEKNLKLNVQHVFFTRTTTASAGESK